MNFLGSTGTFALYAAIKNYATYLEDGGLEEFDPSLVSKFPTTDRCAVHMTAHALYHRETGVEDREILEELRTDCPDYVILLSQFLLFLKRGVIITT
jgi:hypothetical protein